MPASQDVGHLAGLIVHLREQVETHLGNPIESAVVTWPRILALYQEDILDAVEYVGLESPDIRFETQLQHKWAAGMAGHDIGMCHDYSSRAACGEEEMTWPKQSNLAVLLTAGGLECSWDSYFRSAYFGGVGGDEMRGYWFVDFELGLDSLSDGLEDHFWARVEQRIVGLGFRQESSGPIESVEFMGEGAKEQRLQDILRRLVSALRVQEPLWLDDFPVYAAARGAAEFAALI